MIRSSRNEEGGRMGSGRETGGGGGQGERDRETGVTGMGGRQDRRRQY